MEFLPDLTQLQALGFTPRAAERAQQALQEGDQRGFVHELLLHGLWSDVVDETQPRPLRIDRWHEMAANGFPIVDTAALQRLLDAGADPHDITGVVRSAQVLAICNIAQLLDYPVLALGWNLPLQATPHLAGASEETEGAQRLLALRPEVLCRDSSGRYGEPRPLALLQWQALSDETRDHIQSLVRGGHRSHAAALWNQQMSGELRTALDAVQTLDGLWRQGA